MKVFLIRHGKARSAGQGYDDKNRTLSEAGRLQVENHLAPAMEKEGLETIYSSPVVRALQTAECIATATKRHDAVVVSEALCLGVATSDSIARFLDRCVSRGDKVVGVIAHEPAIGQFAEDYLSFLRRIKKGCALEFTWPKGQVDAFIDKKGRKV